MADDNLPAVGGDNPPTDDEDSPPNWFRGMSRYQQPEHYWDEKLQHASARS